MSTEATTFKSARWAIMIEQHHTQGLTPWLEQVQCEAAWMVACGAPWITDTEDQRPINLYQVTLDFTDRQLNHIRLDGHSLQPPFVEVSDHIFVTGIASFSRVPNWILHLANDFLDTGWHNDYRKALR